MNCKNEYTLKENTNQSKNISLNFSASGKIYQHSYDIYQFCCTFAEKMMRNLILIGIFSFFFNVSAQAQLNFFEGYIVLNSGDTIVGEIKVNPKKELALFAKVMFKDPQGITKTYKANKIKAFAYFLADKKKWHRFVAIQEDEPKFYKLVIQYPVMIYEYQYEDMKLGGEFYTAKEYYMWQHEKFVQLNSKKLKKHLAEHINNEELLNEVEKMKELDIDKLSSLLEKHYSKSSS